MSTKAIRELIDTLRRHDGEMPSLLDAAEREVQDIETAAKLLVDPQDWIKAEEFFAALGTDAPASAKSP